MRLSFVTLLTIVCSLAQAHASPVEQDAPNRPDQKPAFVGQTRIDAVRSGVAFKVTPVAHGLEYPWALAFLPDGRALVTEKPGRLRIIGAGGRLLPPIEGTPAVVYDGQGGLLDVIVARASPLRLCLTYSAVRGPKGLTGTTARCSDAVRAGENLKLVNHQIIWEQTPAWAGNHNHFGGRMVLAPDGTLFITNGERYNTPIRERAQDLKAGLGKVVRVDLDGSIPADNPFAHSPDPMTRHIWSYGHRNPQGAALNPVTGQLWTVEHGPKGGDELNAPKPGRNYGWPVITYGEDYNGKPIDGNITRHAGMEQPIYYWDPVIAPSSLMWYTGALFPRWRGDAFIGGLASESITRIAVKGERVTGEEKFAMGHRIRDVAQAPDGSIWAITDEDDAQVLRISPK